ncbi:hypothetical protein AB0H92_01415 [Streptomyces phaeochromogenes]|uniref:hypothetical protein n=1 Tax=Streptomyces phaeochromogenes TaxID=1923 RepID=UPI00340F177D
MAVIFLGAYLVLLLTGMFLEHLRQRKGNYVDEKFVASLDLIADPEKRIRAIIDYRQAVGGMPPQPPPDPPPPGPLPAEAPDGSERSPQPPAL